MDYFYHFGRLRDKNLILYLLYGQKDLLILDITLEIPWHMKSVLKVMKIVSFQRWPFGHEKIKLIVSTQECNSVSSDPIHNIEAPATLAK